MSLKRKAGNLPLGEAKKAKTNASITSFFGAPKPKVLTAAKSSNTEAGSSVPASSALAFSAPESSLPDSTTPAVESEWKNKWVASLTDDQKNLLGLEIEFLHESWLKELREEVTSASFLELKRFLVREHESGKKIFPPAQDVYAWSRYTPLNTVKAVIIGQDPYHNDRQAHGLCFSVQKPTVAPPSLVNIYKCLAIDYPGFLPPPNRSGLLTPWAERGVLMLNTCLTVRAHEANSHSNRGWEKFTQKVIDIVEKKRAKGVVFLAWGAPAAKRVAKVNKEKHCVLTAVHPSPLSARRGWFECGHFRKTNEWLIKQYGEDGAIDWNLGEGDTKLAVSVETGAAVSSSSDAKSAPVASSPAAKALAAVGSPSVIATTPAASSPAVKSTEEE